MSGVVGATGLSWPADHKGVGYRGGCRCTECVRKHRIEGNNYYRSTKAELAELREFKAKVLAAAAEVVS